MIINPVVTNPKMKNNDFIQQNHNQLYSNLQNKSMPFDIKSNQMKINAKYNDNIIEDDEVTLNTIINDKPKTKIIREYFENKCNNIKDADILLFENL